jgi:hypothetical protein
MSDKYSVPAKGINDNVLEGIQCPHCDSQGPFVMAIRSWGYATVDDDGFDDYKTHGTDFEGPCECIACGKDFNFMDFDDNDEDAQAVLVSREIDRMLDDADGEPVWDFGPSPLVTAAELAPDNRPESGGEK